VSKFDTDIAQECECFEEAIPAHPGYFMLVTNYSKHCSEIYYSKVPIVGWVRHKTLEEHDLKDVTTPFWAIPVFGGEYTFSDRNYLDWALLLPDGRVIDPDGFKKDSIETFLKTQSAELKKPCLLI
jgi:hypothetical protein